MYVSCPVKRGVFNRGVLIREVLLYVLYVMETECIVTDQ